VPQYFFTVLAVEQNQWYRSTLIRGLFVAVPGVTRCIITC